MRRKSAAGVAAGAPAPAATFSSASAALSSAVPSSPCANAGAGIGANASIGAGAVVGADLRADTVPGAGAGARFTAIGMHEEHTLTRLLKDPDGFACILRMHCCSISYYNSTTHRAEQRIG